MTDDLKALGIFLKSSDILEKAYGQFRGLAMLPLTTSMNILMLDLNNLPVKPFNFKEVFIRWILQVNEKRILNGDEPIITYNIAKQCPIWKLYKMPVSSSKIYGNTALNLPSLKTISNITKPKNINK